MKFESFSRLCPKLKCLLNTLITQMNIERGVPRNLKRGGGNLKPSVFRPKSSEEQKERPTRPQMSNFPAQSQLKSKKKVITLSDCPLYVYYLYTTKVLCICLPGGGGRPSSEYAPD